MIENLTAENIAYFQETILAWGKANFADFPWRYAINRWHALVAEIMLQRTKAEQVLPAYQEFVSKYETPLDYARDEQATAFGTLGLHWREKLLKDLAGVLAERDEIPVEREDLLKLPGIGSYIAAAYRSMHLDVRDVIIDSNVVRLYGRYFGFETDPETRRKKWFIELSDKLTPQADFKAYNYALLDFTREICKPKPACEICPLNNRCEYGKKKLC